MPAEDIHTLDPVRNRQRVHGRYRCGHRNLKADAAVRLVVRRIPDLNPKADPGQGSLFHRWRFHTFFTTSDPELLTLWPWTPPTAATRSSNKFTPP